MLERENPVGICGDFIYVGQNTIFPFTDSFTPVTVNSTELLETPK